MKTSDESNQLTASSLSYVQPCAELQAYPTPLYIVLYLYRLGAEGRPIADDRLVFSIQT